MKNVTHQFKFYWSLFKQGKLIAAAGLVTLFGQRDLEIAWMTVKNNHLQMSKSDPYLRFLGLCNLEIWRMMIQEELYSEEQ